MLSSATKAAANVTKGLAENDIRNTARDTLRDVQDRGHEVLNDVSGYANEAGQKVRSLFDRTLDNSKSATSKIESEIKSNPIRSSAIALGAGFIIGALLTRR